jgi:hypothetical protein
MGFLNQIRQQPFAASRTILIDVISIQLLIELLSRLNDRRAILARTTRTDFTK